MAESSHGVGVQPFQSLGLLQGLRFALDQKCCRAGLQAGVILGLVVYNNMPGLDVPGAPSAPRSNGLTSCQPQVRDRKAIPACGFQEDQERAFGA